MSNKEYKHKWYLKNKESIEISENLTEYLINHKGAK